MNWLYPFTFYCGMTWGMAAMLYTAQREKDLFDLIALILAPAFLPALVLFTLYDERKHR